MPYVPFYLWDNDSLDSDDGDEKIPQQHIPLGRAAKETLAKLKDRTPAHIHEVRDYWYQMEECRYKNFPEGMNVSEAFRNIGIFITMPDRLAIEILDRVQGKGDETKNVKSDFAKMMIGKLSGQSAAFVYMVDCLWGILKMKRDGEEKERVRMFKDIDLLLQIRDQEVHEMIWILEDMIEKGEIEEEEALRIQGAGPSVTLRADKYPKGIRPRHRHPKLPVTLSSAMCRLAKLGRRDQPKTKRMSSRRQRKQRPVAIPRRRGNGSARSAGTGAQ